MIRESLAGNAEDEFISAIFYVCREFRKLPQTVLEMDVQQFDIILEEMKKHYEKERKANEKANRKSLSG